MCRLHRGWREGRQATGRIEGEGGGEGKRERATFLMYSTYVRLCSYHQRAFSARARP